MQPKKSNRGKIMLIVCIVLVVVIAEGGMRVHSAWALRHAAEDDTTIKVSVITPKTGKGGEEIVLPGTVEAWHQTTIYARTNGYVKRWLTPMGTHVHKDDVLAELETPEVDAQLRQAEADLKTAQANYDLAKITAVRWKNLLKTDSVSKQDADEKISDAKAKEAILASAQASRDHLKELYNFKIIRAPFDGIITLRLLDEGLLVNAGNYTQQPLFNIVQSDHLRVYVKVPEADSARITKDTKAELHFTSHPGEVFKADLYKTAEAIDPTTRTLLIEFIVDNTDGRLFAGGYTQVHIKLPSEKGSLELPVNALIFRAAGLQVATVDDAGKVSLKKVTMGRDFGNEVELSSGISAEDKVVINPPDSLADGQQVTVMKPKKDEPAKDSPAQAAPKKDEKNP